MTKKVDKFYGKRQIYTNLETLGKVKQLAKIHKGIINLLLRMNIKIIKL